MTYLRDHQVRRCVPALLYYLSLFLIVALHVAKVWLSTRRSRIRPTTAEVGASTSASRWCLWAGVVFFGGLAALLLFLLPRLHGVSSRDPGDLVIVLGGECGPSATRGRLGPKPAVAARSRSPRGPGLASLIVCAAACVGIVIGVVTLTGVGTSSAVGDPAAGPGQPSRWRWLLIMVSLDHPGHGAALGGLLSADGHPDRVRCWGIWGSCRWRHISSSSTSA